MTHPRHRRVLLAVATALAAVLGLTVASVNLASAGTAHGHHGPPPAPKPTIVLVHGAFADSSGWNDVAARLLRKGYDVEAFSNPLRDPISDSAYLKTFLATIEGPVVLVAHSYGGVVITNAATGNPNVKALVYIAAFAPDAGESVQSMSALGGGHSDLADHLVFRPYPGAPPNIYDATIDPAYFHELFAADLPQSVTKVMAATQRPASLLALGVPSGEPAWKTIPSWFLVARQDHTIPPEAERFMAARAGSHTIEINSSHVAMMSHPDIVTKLITRAAGS